MIGVIGSVNIDYVSVVDRFPKKGETISSEGFSMHYGGKGANQAIAASFAKGEKVSLFCKINKDDKALFDHLKTSGMPSKSIFFSSKKTGNAFITFSKEKNDNTIIINKCANDDFTKKDITRVNTFIEENEILIFQNEINRDFNDYAINRAHDLNKKIIVNPSPLKNFDREWMKKATILVLNETELEELTMDIEGDRAFKIASIIDSGCDEVILTLGEKGVYVASINKTIPGRKVQVVDTTAAGDVFTGSLAAMLSKGKKIEEAVEFANVAASLAVQKMGAQPSIPSFEEIIEVL